MNLEDFAASATMGVAERRATRAVADHFVDFILFVLFEIGIL